MDNNTIARAHIVHIDKGYDSLRHIGFTKNLVFSYDNHIENLSTAKSFDDRKYVILDDDMIGEAWYEVDRNNKYISHKILYHSCNKVKLRFDYWHKNDNDEMTTLARLNLFNFEFPVNIEIPYIVWLKKLKSKEQVEINITCFPENISLFESNKDCREFNHKEADLFLPVGAFLGCDVAPKDYQQESNRAYICGEVKSFNIRNNRVTGLRYVHFEVQSFGFVYDVVIAEEEMSLEPEKVKYISGNVKLYGYIYDWRYDNYRHGKYWYCDLDKKLGIDDFNNKVVKHLEALRPIGREYLIIRFNKISDTTYWDIHIKAFGNTENGKGYRIKYSKKYSDGKICTYVLVPEVGHCNYEMANKVLYTICVEGKEPLEWCWKEVSNIYN